MAVFFVYTGLEIALSRWAFTVLVERGQLGRHMRPLPLAEDGEAGWWVREQARG